MKTKLARVALILATAIPLSAVAQNAKSPPTRPVAESRQTSDAADPLSTIVPDLNSNQMGLEDIAAYLQDRAPGLKLVLAHPYPDRPDDPHLTFRLKHCSVGQILHVVETLCPVKIETVDGSPWGLTNVIVLHVQRPADDPNVVAAPEIRVYNLKTLGGSTTGPSTTNDVLSLIQKALAQLNGKPAVLEIHEPTSTLIFKGSLKQRMVLEQVLDALDPNRSNPDRRIVRHESVRTVPARSPLDLQEGDGDGLGGAAERGATGDPGEGVDRFHVIGSRAEKSKAQNGSADAAQRPATTRPIAAPAQD